MIPRTWKNSTAYKIFSFRQLATLTVVGMVVFHWPWLLARLHEVTPCSVEESLDVLGHMCQEFNSRAIAGDLCSDICTANNLNFAQCLNHAGGKSTFLLEWHGRKMHVVFKSSKGADYDPTYGTKCDKVTAGTGDGTNDEKFFKKFLEIASCHLRLNTNDRQLLSLVPRLQSDLDLVPSAGKQAWRSSVLSLAEQPEYLTLLLYTNYTHMPPLVGTCGHFYGMPFLPTPKAFTAPIQALRRYGYYKEFTWKDRVLLAVKILDLVNTFNVGTYGPTHICDLKGENFGLDSSGKLVMIDVDMVLSENGLSNELTQKTCTVDEHCTFKFCTGVCNMISKQCSPMRSNTNLQLACTHVFQTHHMNGFYGLLDGLPEAVDQQMGTDLRETLSWCMRTVRSPHNRLAVDAKITNKLRHILTRSIT